MIEGFVIGGACGITPFTTKTTNPKHVEWEREVLWWIGFGMQAEGGGGSREPPNG